uniref:Senescence-specific cysteine protease SAG39 n=1 Tax=Zea mays TaxID=4577 RepID=A0A804RSX8_MAIZE
MATLQASILAVLSFAFFCGAALAARDLNEDSAMVARHEQWMAQYSRVYKDAAEKARRFEVFKANVKFIESFNTGGNRKFWLGINQFADLTNDEFRTTKTNKGFKPSLDKSLRSRIKGNVVAAGHSRPWQPQKGCEGGLMDDAFKFIIKNGGLTTESNYPYTAADGKCKSGSNSAANIKGYEDVPTNDEAALMKAVAKPARVGGSGRWRHDISVLLWWCDDWIMWY